MSIVSMRELIERAEKDNIAVGAFNVGNMEMLIGAISAAEKQKTPIIIQIAESRLSHSPLELMAPMMVEAAKKSEVKVAVNFDHGKTHKNIERALTYGFTSVMFDGSSLSLDDNIKKTNECAILARHYKANLEAELGVLGGSEGEKEKSIIYTRPEDAVRFSKEADFDFLAVAIGNAHGNYKEAPNLQFNILEEIHKNVNKPLVLHGGTGISPGDFQKCINNGIRKINIATANFDACTNGALSLAGKQGNTYFSLNEAMIDAVEKNVIKHIKIFNMEALEES